MGAGTLPAICGEGFGEGAVAVAVAVAHPSAGAVIIPSAMALKNRVRCCAGNGPAWRKITRPARSGTLP